MLVLRANLAIHQNHKTYEKRLLQTRLFLYSDCRAFHLSTHFLVSKSITVQKPHFSLNLPSSLRLLILTIRFYHNESRKEMFYFHFSQQVFRSISSS